MKMSVTADVRRDRGLGLSIDAGMTSPDCSLFNQWISKETEKEVYYLSSWLASLLATTENYFVVSIGICTGTGLCITQLISHHFRIYCSYITIISNI